MFSPRICFCRLHSYIFRPFLSYFSFSRVKRKKSPDSQKMRRVTQMVGLSAVAQVRNFTYPMTAPPIEITYLDSDPLEYAVRTEARVRGYDDFYYHRELAFVRINDNPTVGQFRAMTKEQRRRMFWGSNRQDFFVHLTWKVLGTPEHLYHEGW